MVEVSTMSSVERTRRGPDPPDANAVVGERVFTLGYQGRSLSEVLAVVHDLGIAVVIDVRENARSRKPGFSSSELEAALRGIGVGYLHLPELGCERESRHALWRGAPTEEFVRDYRRRLEQRFRSVDDLVRRVRGATSLLLCLERDPSRCHRAVLGERLREAGLTVQDL